jgi:hypothetical protein
MTSVPGNHGHSSPQPRPILVPISVGELIDKVTILRIKTRHIKDPGKLENINNELKAMLRVCSEHHIDPSSELARDLERVNEALWVIEDKIRDKERAKTFDSEFVELARAVYVQNDSRFKVKSQINDAHGSCYREEKSYQPY